MCGCARRWWAATAPSGFTAAATSSASLVSSSSYLKLKGKRWKTSNAYLLEIMDQIPRRRCPVTGSHHCPMALRMLPSPKSVPNELILIIYSELFESEFLIHWFSASGVQISKKKLETWNGFKDEKNLFNSILSLSNSDLKMNRCKLHHPWILKFKYWIWIGMAWCLT